MSFEALSPLWFLMDSPESSQDTALPSVMWFELTDLEKILINYLRLFVFCVMCDIWVRVAKQMSVISDP